MTPYMLSINHQRQSPIHLQRRRFPDFFGASSQWVAAAAAVGSDASMGAHLGVVIDQFHRRVRSTGSKAQLDKEGISLDDCLEIRESLLNTKHRYA